MNYPKLISAVAMCKKLAGEYVICPKEEAEVFTSTKYDGEEFDVYAKPVPAPLEKKYPDCCTPADNAGKGHRYLPGCELYAPEAGFTSPTTHPQRKNPPT